MTWSMFAPDDDDRREALDDVLEFTAEIEEPHRPRLWRWLMRIIWATPEENARYAAIDDEISFPHLHGSSRKPRFPDG